MIPNQKNRLVLIVNNIPPISSGEVSSKTSDECSLPDESSILQAPLNAINQQRQLFSFPVFTRPLSSKNANMWGFPKLTTYQLINMLCTNVPIICLFIYQRTLSFTLAKFDFPITRAFLPSFEIIILIQMLHKKFSGVPFSCKQPVTA